MRPLHIPVLCCLFHIRVAGIFGITLAVVGCGSDDEPSARNSPDGGGGQAGRGSNGGSAAGSGGTGASGSGGTSGSGGSGGTSGTGGVSCAPLPAATGKTVAVSASKAGELPSIVSAATTGTTIVLEDGTYTISAPLWFRTPGVTLRSASNDPTKTIIDGNYAVDETVAIQTNDITIAHVTLTRAVNHPVHVSPPDGNTNVTGTVLYGVDFIDGGEQFVKVNPNAARTAYVDEGRVECSLFRLTDQGRPHIEPNPGGCYTGGIDVHGGQNWVVRNNRFEDIYCDNGSLPEHAIHFWTGSRGTLVENNQIFDCGRGIGFGLGDTRGERVYADRPYAGELLGHYDGIIRNNVIFADNAFYDTGIELHVAKRPIVLHNTIVHGPNATKFFRSIDYRYAATDVVIVNNLTRAIGARDGAQGTVQNNYDNTPLDYFVSVQNRDFHLKASASEALDKGVPRSESGVDIDGRPHDQGAPDLGADEYVP